MTVLAERLDDVSRETLERYATLLGRWTRKINLVAASDAVELWERHILDCRRVADLIPQDAESYLDIGSGAGLPGVVVAILRPDLATTIIEADQRKCAFLRAARRELSLSVDIVCSRIEAVDPLCADVVSARALAPLSQLLTLAVRHGRSSTRYLFMKGEQWEQEVAMARTRWSFDLETAFPDAIGLGPILVITRVSEIG